MKICKVLYEFNYDFLKIIGPYQICKETEKYYIAKDGKKIAKENFGEVVLKSPAGYPYLELNTEETDEKVLREQISNWFTNTAERMKTKEARLFPE